MPSFVTSSPSAAPRPLPPDARVAVVGSGISGLAAAWLLGQRHHVTLFEADTRLGGHTNTVDVAVDGVSAPVDTGFLVFNHHTYPNLTALFAHLGVASTATDMSFAVSFRESGLEWAGTNLNTVFGQRRNLLKPAFWRMLRDILRFNREAPAWLDAQPHDPRSLGAYLADNGYSREFSEWYLLPMAAAIWSCPTGKMLDYPLATFVRFCRNHGLLQVANRPQWRTVLGGGREYVAKLALGIDTIHLATPVRGVERQADGRVRLHAGSGDTTLGEVFDAVVLACHSDQALAILGDGTRAEEKRLLGALRYEPNVAWLHTDPALLPRRRSLWSAWNYVADRPGLDARPVGVSYLINQLQPLPFATPVVVTLNPDTLPRDEHVLARFDYAHPLFDGPAIAAQAQLATLQGQDGVWFCGAWGGYGFHEDGLKSALAVANALGCRAPWQGQPQAAPAGAPSQVPAWNPAPVLDLQGGGLQSRAQSRV